MLNVRGCHVRNIGGWGPTALVDMKTLPDLPGQLARPTFEAIAGTEFTIIWTRPTATASEGGGVQSEDFYRINVTKADTRRSGHAVRGIQQTQDHTIRREMSSNPVGPPDHVNICQKLLGGTIRDCLATQTATNPLIHHSMRRQDEGTCAVLSASSVCQCKVQGDFQGISQIVGGTQPLTFLVNGLRKDTKYTVSIAAINLAGQGAYSDPTNVFTTNQVCKLTEYKSGTACLACVLGGVCDSSETVYAQKGFWQDMQHIGDPDRVYKCPMAQIACEGTSGAGNSSGCVQGYHGTLCGICEIGYHRDGDTCVPCGEVSYEVQRTSPHNHD